MLRDRSERDDATASVVRSDLCFRDGVRWTLRAAVTLALGSALAALGRTARAESRTSVELAYEIAPDTHGCPGADEFQSTVKRQLGYDPFRPAADRHVAVKIAQKETGFAGWIKWSDARGHWVGDRRLSSLHSDCGEIAANLAFAVAVQIQLLATLAPESSEPSPPATSPVAAPPTSPVTAPPSAPTPSSATTAAPPTTPPRLPASRRARLRLSAGLGPSLALGVAPHVTGLGRIFVSGGIDPLSLELAVDAALPASRTQTDGSGFSLDRIAAGAAACGHVRAFAACLTATVGRLEARGFGVDRPTSPAGLFSQLGARIAATHDFGDRYFASARVDGLVMLSPWTVTLDDSVAWTTPRVGGLVGVDFGIYFF